MAGEGWEASRDPDVYPLKTVMALACTAAMGRIEGRVGLLDPIDHGIVEGRRRRFVPISGGTVSGPDFEGVALPGGGDWQAIGTDGSTMIDAHYALRASDGTVIDVRNAGVRVASVEVSERIARGEPVDPGSYYFRTAPPLRGA